MNDWNIQSRAHACSACQKPFADKAAYHTVLSEDADGLHRRDVCPECWEKAVRDEIRSQAGFVSHWQGIYESPPAPDAEPIEKEGAESLLRKLIELEDPKYIPAAYILAVMLERKRILKVKEELQREGRRLFVYEHPRSGDVFTVADPALQLDQLEAVQREVSSLMQHGLTPPPDERNPPEPETAGENAAGDEPRATPAGVSTT